MRVVRILKQGQTGLVKTESYTNQQKTLIRIATKEYNSVSTLKQALFVSF